MGTMLAAEIRCGLADDCESGFRLIRSALDSVDAAMSVYHGSEITQINAAAGTAVYLQPVGESTEQVLRAALDAANKTGGAFDITIKPLADLYGFYRREASTTAHIPSPAEISRVLALVGYRDLVLAPRRAGLRRKGMQIDLGGIAKGFALDQAAAALLRAGYTEFTLNFGGQILAHGIPTPVVVKHPLKPGKDLLLCEINSGSISVSAQSERYRIAGGRKIGHLINPRTGESERENLTTVVYHTQAMYADAYSTALFFTAAPAFDAYTCNERLVAYKLDKNGNLRVSETAKNTAPCKIAD